MDMKRRQTSRIVSLFRKEKRKKAKLY